MHTRTNSPHCDRNFTRPFRTPRLVTGARAILASLVLIPTAFAAPPAVGIHRVPNVLFRSISADGSVAIGIVSDFLTPDIPTGVAHPVRWTPQVGLQDLPVPDDARSAQGTSMSWSGEVLAGTVFRNSGDVVGGGQHVAMWDSEGLHLFDDLAGGTKSAECRFVSPNGAIIVGAGRGPDEISLRAVRWTTSGTVLDLGALQGLPTQAAACSFDGSIIVGDTASNALVWRWSEDLGYQTIPIQGTRPIVIACTPDSRYIVGTANGTTERFSWIWDSVGQVQTNIAYPEAMTTLVTGISADGRTIVGSYRTTSDTSIPPRSFVYDATHGVRDLRSVASELFDYDTGELNTAKAISADGRTIVGSEFILRLPAPCSADVDDGTGSGGRDDEVNTADLASFIHWFITGDPLADLDDGSGQGLPDASITLDDLLYFLQGYHRGC